MDVTLLTSAAQPLFEEAAALLDQYRQHYGANPAPEALVDWMREQVSFEHMRIYLAGEALGICTVSCAPAALTLRTVWLVRDLYVRPDARRRGIARTLLNHVAEDAREGGAHRLTLQTESSNVRAIELYAKDGFHALTDVTVMDRLL